MAGRYARRPTLVNPGRRAVDRAAPRLPAGGARVQPVDEDHRGIEAVVTGPLPDSPAGMPAVRAYLDGMGADGRRHYFDLRALAVRDYDWSSVARRFAEELRRVAERT
ncbi:MAG TPA: hypothetical protein VK966_06380 [Longimicrobiales bacterium]|nr:hypothetical protein [Longimicrobiales bacterium]